MCIHFTPSPNKTWIKKHLGIDLPATDFPAQAYPGYLAPIAMKSRTSGRMACGLAKFGLIPHWAKDEKIGRHTYNARSETVSQKPSYRLAWRQRQYGIVMADCFFEPNYVSGRAQNWKIELESNEPFGIACLWDKWTDPISQAQVVSFTMLTINADAHPVMNQFHKRGDEKRTPVILSPDQYTDWLSAAPDTGMQMMNWDNMPLLKSEPASFS